MSSSRAGGTFVVYLDQVYCLAGHIFCSSVRVSEELCKIAHGRTVWDHSGVFLSRRCEEGPLPGLCRRSVSRIVLAPSVTATSSYQETAKQACGGAPCPSTLWRLTVMVISQLCLEQEATAGLLRGMQPKEGNAL